MEVISGCINQTGILKIKTTKEFGESTVAKILDLVETAARKKPAAKTSLPALPNSTPRLLFLRRCCWLPLPPYVLNEPFSGWVYRALTFLVISCPCALVISIPLSFFGGIGGASKCGVLVKGSNYLEALADTETFAKAEEMGLRPLAMPLNAKNPLEFPGLIRDMGRLVRAFRPMW